MGMTALRARPVGLALALAFTTVGFVWSGTALAQEGKTQEVDAGGLTFQAPAAWKSTPPQSQMRRAQMKIDPAQGDADPAELIVFAFPGGAGSVDANVARWQQQFRDKDGNPPKPEVKTVKGKNVDVSRVELAGHYFPATFPGQPQQPDREGYRLLAARSSSPTTPATSPPGRARQTVNAAKPAFDAMLSRP
ncbi:MAG: hypothetical protein U0835_06875 [Isosphaeraceae bacterium]